MNIKKGWFLCVFILLILSGCSIPQSNSIRIIDAKIVTGINENLMPIKVTDAFPKGTPEAFCWFQWQDAKIDTEIVAKWHYVSDNIHIIDYAFKLPRKEGVGGVLLSMPEGKTLPSGSYQIELVSGKRALKSLAFKIQ